MKTIFISSPNTMKYNHHSHDHHHVQSLSSATTTTTSPSSSSTTSFVNDDYECLINDNDLINTCQQALQENDYNHSQTSSSIEYLQQQQQQQQQQCELSLINTKMSSSINNCQQQQQHLSANINCDHHQQQQQQSNLHDFTLIRSPSSAASSGLGLSLEEDLSLKYCQSDEEFSSLNSTATNYNEMMNESNSTTAALATTSSSFTAKALVAEFIEWLDYNENQLDSVCYCAKIARDANESENGDNYNDDDDDDVDEDDDDDDSQKLDNQNDHIVDYTFDDDVDDDDHHPHPELIVNHSTCQQQQQRPAIIDDDEAEESMMSMKPILNDESLIINNSQQSTSFDDIIHINNDVTEQQQQQQQLSQTIFQHQPSPSSSSSSSFQMSMSKTNLCLLPETIGADWSVILARHEAYQNEFEKITHQFFRNINQLTRTVVPLSSLPSTTITTAPINASSSSNESLLAKSSSPTTNNNNNNDNLILLRSIKQQKDRCQNLWLKSLEYLTILEKYSGKRCPRHYFVKYSNNKNVLNEIKINADELALSSTTSTSATTTTITLSSDSSIQKSHQHQNHYQHYRHIFSADSHKQSTSKHYRNTLLFSHRNPIIDSDNNNNNDRLQQLRLPTPPPPPPPSQPTNHLNPLNRSYAAVVASSSLLNNNNSSSLSIGFNKTIELKQKQSSSIGTDGKLSIFDHLNHRVHQTNASSLLNRISSTFKMANISNNQNQNNQMEQSSDSLLLLSSTSSSSSCDVRDCFHNGGTGSPGADSGVYSSSMDNSMITSSSSSSSTMPTINIKYDIIQKDIGYSSDADMSDAIEAQPNLSDNQNGDHDHQQQLQNQQKSSKKRHIRRRRTRTNRNRPWSYHADWTAWDYYQTPFFCDHFSNEDLNYVDNENIVKRLTEFGENYESWINNELDLTDLDIRAESKPAVVIEKPEIEEHSQQTIVEKVDACIATSPIPYSDKECQINDQIFDDIDRKQNKCTQTRIKNLIDSYCQPISCPPSPNKKTKETATTKATIPTIKIKPNRLVRKFDNNNINDDMMIVRRSPSPSLLLMKKASTNNNQSESVSQSTSTIEHVCSCGHHCHNFNNRNNNDSSPYTSIKFYTSVALAGLLSFLIAVTQFSPEIHKTYPRPPPL